jgi:hypothetical protein
LDGLLAGSSLYQSSLKHKNQYRAVPHRRSSPSRYVLWSVAPLRLFVVDLPNLTSQISRFLSVEANVESLTIGGVGVLGVDNQLSVGVRLFRLGALEPILQLVCEQKRKNLIFSSLGVLLVTSLLHPCRPPASGQTQVPVNSSKCRPAVQVISVCSPSMQL